MPNLDHPTLPFIKSRFSESGDSGKRELFATEFRGETTIVVKPADLHDLLAFLKNDDDCKYDFLSDIAGIDYLNYPRNKDDHAPTGRFAVVYNLESTTNNTRLFVKVLLDPTLDTHGIEDDPALHLPTCTDLWMGGE